MLTLLDNDTPPPHTLYSTRIEVRWGDLDIDGHVNNTVILRYVEEARMRWAQHLRLHESAPQLMPIVASIACKYLAPIGYPATLEVDIGCARLGNSSLQLVFAIREASDEAAVLYARAYAAWIWIDAESRRPQAMPPALREACSTTS